MQKTAVWKRLLSFAMMVCMVATSVLPNFVYAAEAESPPLPSSEIQIEASTTGTEVVPGNVNELTTPVPTPGITQEGSESMPTKPPEEGKGELDSPASPAPDSTSAPDANVEGTPEPPASAPTEDANSGNESTPSEEKNEGETEVPDENIPPESSDENSVTPTPSPDSVPTDGTEEETEDKPIVDEEKSEEQEKAPAADFVALQVLDPEETTVIANSGEEVTLTSGINRDDVLVEYQWQKLVMPAPRQQILNTQNLYGYSENEPTSYRFVIAGKTESELLAENPDTVWAGIELYKAAKAALESIDCDTSALTFAWRTRNYALDGFSISAEMVDGSPVLYAEKDGKRFTGKINDYGEYEFANESIDIPAEEPESVWTDIEDATQPTYTFTTNEESFRTSYRLKVIIRDEAYLAEVVDILSGQNVELTEEQKSKDQILYSVTMHVDSSEAADVVMEETPVMLFQAFSNFVQASSGDPKLSADGQWIENLTTDFQYITEETYQKGKAWLDAGEITPTQFDRLWTRMLHSGWGGHTVANVLDENGKPVGGEDNTRFYNGFNLTHGKLEVASEWYGKTVYFRVRNKGKEPGNTEIGTAIKIPAYTELYDAAGDKLSDTASGSKYKKAVSFLNAWTPDAGAVYRDYLRNAAINADKGSTTSFAYEQGTHISSYDVDCESFNSDPARYMVDAEGNYRMDSVGWGVCVYDEPDLSGKSYWQLKDYISNGYGFITGHDTLYAYAGSFHDAYGVDLDEKSIDPNDGVTWYYDLNSYQPSAHQSNGATAGGYHRGGHFYLNELMGTNAGHARTGVGGGPASTIRAEDAPSLILSTGSSNGPIRKDGMYAGNNLEIKMVGFPNEVAAKNPRYRTPTNYPFAYNENEVIAATYTHTNGQAAFGPVWVDYAEESWGLLDENYGLHYWEPGTKPPADKWRYSRYRDALTFTDKNGRKGTNNFYLTGQGNYLMNQIGHIPKQTAAIHETKLFVNSVMYVSQRKQCEVCAANQGHETSHFVRRVSGGNWDAVITALQGGGNYWYPIDGCYMLTEDVTLPENWEPIKGFQGHWNSDKYVIKLPTSGKPFFDNSKDDGESGWNLGTDKAKGRVNVFKNDGSRSTGVSRVVGFLTKEDTYFDGKDSDYAGYTVVIHGPIAGNPATEHENEGKIPAGESYSCTLNNEGKYVISNLPCLFTGTSGTLQAHVYDTKGVEVKKYGKIRVDIPEDFWDNEMTTVLYLGGNFRPRPIPDQKVYESLPATFSVNIAMEEKVTPENIKWQWRTDSLSDWQEMSTGPWGTDFSITAPRYAYDDFGDVVTSLDLTLNHTKTTWTGYQFRCLFTDATKGTANSYEGYVKDKVWYTTNKGDCQDEANKVNGVYHKVFIPGKQGQLTVLGWPGSEIIDPVEQNVMAGTDTKIYTSTFTGITSAKGEGLGKNMQVMWQYTDDGGATWTDVNWSDQDGHMFRSHNLMIPDYSEIVPTDSDEYKNYAGGAAAKNNIPIYRSKATLDVKDIDPAMSGYQFRAVWSYTTYSDVKASFNGQPALVRVWTPTVSSNLQTGNAEVAKKVSEADGDDTGSCDFGGGDILKVGAWGANQHVTYPINGKTYDVTQHYQKAEHIQTLHGQTVTLNFAAGKQNGVYHSDETATYVAVLYYRPGVTVNPDWQFTRMGDSNKYVSWNEMTGRLESGNPNMKVVIDNQDLGVVTKGNPYYNAAHDGFGVVISAMTITGATNTMDDETTYLFRCRAKADPYTTYFKGKEIQNEGWANSQPGELRVNYLIEIKHNGVTELHRNVINGKMTHTVQENLRAIAGHNSSVWAYPDLKVTAPQGVQTALLQFTNQKFAHGDVLKMPNGTWKTHPDGTPLVDKSNGNKTFTIQASGSTVTVTYSDGVKVTISISGNNSPRVMMTSNNGRLSEDLWSAVMQRIEFTTFDKLTQLSSDGKPINGTGDILFYIDENKWAGDCFYNGDNGHMYQYVDAGRHISWFEAETAAENIPRPELDVPGGYLAHINSAEEWNFVQRLIRGDAKGWLGAIRGQNPRTPDMNHSTKDWWWYDAGVDISPREDSSSIFLRQHELQGDRVGHDAQNGRWPGNWANGEPNDFQNANEQCLHFYEDKQWNDFNAYNDGVTAYIVEWGKSNTPLSLGHTEHSASDVDSIYTSAPSLAIEVKIAGGEKIYDGKEINPTITVGQPYRNDVMVTIKDEKGNIIVRATPVSSFQHSQVIHFGTYTATLTSDKYKFTSTSVTSAELKVFKRGLDFYSTDDKVYDRKPTATIQNIKVKPLTDKTGIIGNDKVWLAADVKDGYYCSSYPITNLDANPEKQYHTGSWSTKPNNRPRLVNDPHKDYFINSIDFKGKITPRPVKVHSLYIEPEYPLEKTGRNIKNYDGTDVANVYATILDPFTAEERQNIFISPIPGNKQSGIVSGDSIGIDKDGYSGHYASKDALEPLPIIEPELLHLTEQKITLDVNPQLTNNEHGDYEIVEYDFSGAISRLRMEIRANRHVYLYGTEFKGDRLPGQAPAPGDIGHPRPFDKHFYPNKGATPDSWLTVEGLVPGDELILRDDFVLESYNEDGSIRTFDNTTPVGHYVVEIRDINETIYPVLKNYFVTFSNGAVIVNPREIVIRPEDIDRSVEQDKDPLETFAHFLLIDEEGKGYMEVGNDRDMDYGEMLLANDDTVLSTILYKNNTSLSKPFIPGIQRANVAEGTTYFKNVSAVPFLTDWMPGSPVKYSAIQNNLMPQECEWCEHYYGYDQDPNSQHHKFDTAHWLITGYNLEVNQKDRGAGSTLKVATVKNLNGEDVQNYVIRYENALLRVHPRQRVQLEATVPMYVCMYGFSETGDVVTPDDYGIRNYSNVPIQVENINVSNDGWNVVNRPQHELQRGEISMKMHRNQLVTGNNKPIMVEAPGQTLESLNAAWLIRKDDTPKGIGIWSQIPIEAYIAGDSQNAIGESYVTHVTYTVGEYGLTLPSIPGIIYPDEIDGKPVFPVEDTFSYPTK